MLCFLSQIGDPGLANYKSLGSLPTEEAVHGRYLRFNDDFLDATLFPLQIPELSLQRFLASQFNYIVT
jgi:hypothetical protein